jgi:hypothetical protein
MMEMDNRRLSVEIASDVLERESRWLTGRVYVVVKWTPAAVSGGGGGGIVVEGNATRA